MTSSLTAAIRLARLAVAETRSVVETREDILETRLSEGKAKQLQAVKWLGDWDSTGHGLSPAIWESAATLCDCSCLVVSAMAKLCVPAHR